nr:fluoride efflux transporter CrcB [Cohnella sp. CFH 77786]
MALAVGAFIGAVLRYEMGQWVAPLPNGFPAGTLAINLAGCLFLGWFLTASASRLKIPQTVRIGLGTGLTGSFTTFSTFSVEAVNLCRSGQVWLAALYVGVSIAGGIGLAGLGHLAAKSHFHSPKERTSA